ncbi:hypothetical protein V8E55_012105 [Tylopilus felleus]
MTADGHDCGAVLPAGPTLVSAHLRNAHTAGDSNERTTCLWSNCQLRPIQRRSIVRHVLSVHLKLLKWTCPQCFRTFSRKATLHNCHLDDGVLPHE